VAGCRIRDGGRAARDGPKVESRPDEVVDLVEHDPGPFAVEAEMTFHVGRDLEGGVGCERRRVRDRQDVDVRVNVDGRRRENDGAGPILEAFLLAPLYALAATGMRSGQ